MLVAECIIILYYPGPDLNPCQLLAKHLLPERAPLDRLYLYSGLKFSRVTSNVRMLIRRTKYELIIKLITHE